jgi:hypothetical protein
MQTGGIRDPAMLTTHSKTSSETLDLVLDSPDMKPLISSKLSHMSQWDSARLETEVQLSHDSLGRDVGFAALVHVTQNGCLIFLFLQ